MLRVLNAADLVTTQISQVQLKGDEIEVLRETKTGQAKEGRQRNGFAMQLSVGRVGRSNT